MPSYDYQCEDCKHIQDEFHSMSGPSEPIKCAKCSSLNIKKMVCSPYVMFDGPGWETNTNRGIAKLGTQDVDSCQFRD